MATQFVRRTSNATGSARMEIQPQAVASSTVTSLHSDGDFHVTEMTFTNTNGSAVTILVQDNQTTPAILIPTVSLAANSVMTVDFPEGALCVGGVSWQASTTGVWGRAKGF
jgi:hypothetical protein